MLGSFVAVVTLWANVNSSQSPGTNTKTNLPKAAEKTFCRVLYPHTHRLWGVGFFWKHEATSPKKRCQEPPERITIAYIKAAMVSSRGQPPLPSHFLVWRIPRAAPYLDATPWVMEQDMRCSRKVDLTPCMALPLQFCMHQSFYFFIFLLQKLS